MPEPATTIFRAAAVRDAAPRNPADFRPGALAVREGRIVAVGEPEAVEKEAKHHGPVNRIDLPDRLILPAMVNAHAHLDLTDVGPVPYESVGRDFIKWIEMVMKRRPQTEEEITRAVRHGLASSRAAGVGWLGDIAGSDAAMTARLYAPENEWTGGISFLECFGIEGQGWKAAREAGQRRLHWAHEYGQHARAGELWAELQPHAPYSAGPFVFAEAQAALLAERVASTHLAETPEETEFVSKATGPFVELLRRMRKWDDSVRPTGLSPAEYFKRHLCTDGNWLLVHCNYITDADLRTLASLHGCCVVYCPIASDYFGHRHHRYRDMLAAGINVCLGTDSILCQPADEAQPLGILPQMRHLYRRDGTDPATLLAMATWRGARAMLQPGDSELGTILIPSAKATLVSIRIDPSDPADTLVQALLNDNLVEPLLIPGQEPT